MILTSHRVPRAWVLLCLLMVAVCASAGCSSEAQLVASPNLYSGGAKAAGLLDLPVAVRNPQMDVLFATDREVASYHRSGPQYGFGRCGDLVCGLSQVGFSDYPTWEQLAEASAT